MSDFTQAIGRLAEHSVGRPAEQGERIPRDYPRADVDEVGTAETGRLVSEAIMEHADELARLYRQVATAHEAKAQALVQALRAQAEQVMLEANEMARLNLEHTGNSVNESRHPPPQGNGRG